MKNKFTVLSAITALAVYGMFFPGHSMAQAPRLLNYQAIVRDAAGTPVANNTPVRLQFIIHQNSPNGTAVFTETQTTQANQFGLVAVRVGDSIALVVNWAGYDQYLEVDADVNHTGTFTPLGTSRLISVPYALDAASADNTLPGDATNGHITMVNNDSLANSIITQNATGITINGINTEQSLWVSSNYTINAAVFADRQGPFGYTGSFTDSVSMDVGTTQGNTTGNLNLVTNLTPRLSINGAGQIGIATPAQSFHQLTLGGDLMIQNLTSEHDIYLSDFQDDSVEIGVNSGYFFFLDDNSPYASIWINRTNNDIEPYADNETSLGTSAARWSVVYAGNGMIQTSDIRMKKNISALNLGLSAIMQLHPVSYEWKNPSDGEGQKIGFIAQEVENVIPQAVVHDQMSGQQIAQAKAAHKPLPEITDPYGMNYSEIIPVMVKGMQEQQKMIEELKKRNAGLEMRVKALEKN